MIKFKLKYYKCNKAALMLLAFQIGIVEVLLCTTPASTTPLNTFALTNALILNSKPQISITAVFLKGKFDRNLEIRKQHHVSSAQMGLPESRSSRFEVGGSGW